MLALLFVVLGVAFFVLTMLSIYHVSPDEQTKKKKYTASIVLGILSLIAIYGASWGGESTQTGSIALAWLILLSLTIMALIVLGGKAIEVLVKKS